MLTEVFFNSFDSVNNSLETARKNVELYRIHCESIGEFFLYEKNLVFRYILKEYCPCYHEASNYKVNQSACRRFGVGKTYSTRCTIEIARFPRKSCIALLGMLAYTVGLRRIYYWFMVFHLIQVRGHKFWMD